MLLKWIACDVAPGRRNAFDVAQQQWRAIANLDGFHGQTGGWSVPHENRACIVAFWRDRAALEAFMRGAHDVIFKRARQSETYTSNRVTVAKFEAAVPGHAIATANTIRVSAGAIDLIGEEPLRIELDHSLDDELVRIEPAWRLNARDNRCT